MKKIRKVTVLFTAALFIFGIAGGVKAAQEKWESALQFSGGFFHAEGADSGTLNTDISYGFFLFKSMEVGIIQSLAYNFIDNGDDEWIASTIPFVNYHILGLSEKDVFQPFIGAFFGASYNDDDVTGTVGPQLGLTTFITEKTYVVVKYRYEWFFDDLTVNDIEDTSSDGNHVVTIGLGIVF